MKDNKNEISLRPLLAEDIPEAMKLKDAEGWNQTVKDWQVFVEGQQNINLIAELEGETTGTVTAINYDNAVAWLGMMIVNKAFRGLGISRNLMSTTIEQLNKNNCESIKLDATPQGRPVYVKLGFVEEYTIYRMVHQDFDQVPDFDMDSGRIEPVANSHISDIIDLDRKIFGANRSQLLKEMINNYPERSFVLIRDGQVAGFVLGRAGTRFSQIGPVMTANDKDAMALFSSALKPLKNQSIVIDLLEDKIQVSDWLTSIGFASQRPLYRMYLEKNPYPGKPDSQYAICGPEFG